MADKAGKRLYEQAVRDGQKKEQKEQFVGNPLLSGPSASMALIGGSVDNVVQKMRVVGDEHVKAVSASGSKNSRLKNSKTGTLTGTMADKINPKKSKKRR